MKLLVRRAAERSERAARRSRAASCSSDGCPGEVSRMPRWLVSECMRARIFAEENRKWMTLAAVSFGLFMIMLDNTVVNVALPSIQRDLGADLSELAVDRHRLRADVRVADAGRREGRRRLRPPLIFVIGIVVFTLASLLCGLADSSRDAHRGARPAGSRRGADESRDALDHRGDVPAAPARDGDRDLGGDLGARARDRPPRRRPHHRAPRLELDLLRQRSGRRSRDRRELPLHRRVARRDACEPRPARPGDVGRRPLRADVRPHRGEHVRLDFGAHRRRVRRSLASSLAAFVVHRAPSARPDAAARPLPQRHLHGRESRRAPRRARDVRRLLLRLALHAEHPRLLRRCRPAPRSCR